MAVDAFGTLQLNLTRSDLEGTGVKEVRIAGERIDGLCLAFGDRPPGSLMALIDSSEHLSVAVVNGSAAARLKSGPGMEVLVVPV